MNSFLQERQTIKTSEDTPELSEVRLKDPNEISELEAVTGINQETAPAPVSPEASSAADEPLPEVETVSRDGVVRKIILRFANGKILELDCKY